MLITNATAFTGNEFRTGWQVRMEADTITETAERLPALPGETVLDLQGDYLLPGFVDVHIHACAGADTMRGEEDIRAMSRTLAHLGVAAFCPTTMSADEAATEKALAGIREVMRYPERGGALVLGAHMEAPFLSEKHAGAQQAGFFRNPDREALLQLAGNCPDIVRLITLAPEKEGSEAFIRWAASEGIHVSIGHTDADAETVHRAADWAQTM